MIYLLRSLAAVIGLLGFNTAVHAQDAKNYPARPVRLVVP